MHSSFPSSIETLDKKHVWHPFTANDGWLDPTFHPIVIASGEGSYLTDEEGHRYLDGNSSIWTNLHGHAHPLINQAIRDQLDLIAHSSFLGLTNTLAPKLAETLTRLAHPNNQNPGTLTRVFFSDDGSTAMEAGLKILFQYFQQNREPQRTTVVSLGSAYHGDTVGSMSMGHIPAFHHTYQPLLFKTEEVTHPHCYRCPFNKAKPEKADARVYRKCSWECVDQVEQTFAKTGKTSAAWVLEPRVQGAAGFIMHPEGYLEKTCHIAREHGAKILLDEVMTGFGRTGSLFAHQKEKILPDILALAKGLTGGYLPLAATLATEELFEGFSGDLSRTFFHGHSYTGNQLGCSAALASLKILNSTENQNHRRDLEQTFEEIIPSFWTLPYVGDIRREGLILAIEIVEDPSTRKPFPPEKRAGYHICQTARQHGLLTRPVNDVLLLMPPYSTTTDQLKQMAEALRTSITETLTGP